MPFYFQLNREYAAVLRDFAMDNKLYLAFGCPGLEATDSDKDSLHNRIYLLSPTGASPVWYDKRHLVPFGEYMPLTAHIPFLEKLMQGMDFTPGTRTDPLPLRVAGDEKDSQGLSLGMLICYEAIFPELAQARVNKGASVLVNVSNDGWFKRSIAPWQHLSLSVMRAVEQARPIARSTNTGVSAVIDARGRVVEQGKGQFVAESLAAEVRPSFESTLFHRLYPQPQYVLTFLALTSLLFGFTFLRR
jgi:apolipoprotein N-acyltransferase